MINLDTFGAKPLPPYPYFAVSVRSLIRCDGPLLSVYRAIDGTLFLKYWCDCSDDRQKNRWLIFEVYENRLYGYEIQKRISLRELMDASCKGKQVYLLDGTQHFLVDYDKLPEDYKPNGN
jgi:hypothetical protein